MKHGSRYTYVHHKCRCDACTKANTEYGRKYNLTKAHHYWNPHLPATPTDLVDAEPARQHVKRLSQAGIGEPRTAELAGTTRSTINRLLRGDTNQPTPTQKLPRDTADRILAVEISVRSYSGGAQIPATGTRRRLQALVHVGYPMTTLARLLGIHYNTCVNLVNAHGETTFRTAVKVAGLYTKLWDKPPVAVTAPQKRAVSQARNYARKRGYAPPLAWNNIDDPNDKPRGVAA